MAKKDGILGISLNHGRIAMTILKAGQVSRTIWEDVPDNIVDGARILSRNLFADFLQEKLKDNGIKCKKAAYTISDEDLFIRNITMPYMTDAQLMYNIPFEFTDYIHGEMKDYLFDFIKRSTGDGDIKEQAKILAYAVPLATITEIRQTLEMAGLKLVKALPETIAFEALLGKVSTGEDDRSSKCFLDIGRRGIRMNIFKNGEYSLTHQIDVGEGHAINAIADELGVDTHLATTYLRSNHNNCNELTPVVNAFKDISLEVLKGLNYYEMSDISSKLGDVILCGTGALTEPLVEILKERIDKNVYTMDEFMSAYSSDKNINVTYASVGVLLSDAKGIAGDLSTAGMPKKKKINFAVLVPSIVICLIILGLIGKFVVYDQFAHLAREVKQSKELYARIEEQNKIIEESGELVSEYAHYTWDGMTEEEKGRVKRTEIADLVNFIKTRGIDVEYYSLSGTVMTINIRADSLESVSKLLNSVKELDIVESSSVVYASTKDVEKKDKNSTANEEGAEAVIKTGNTVEAQINVYITNLGE